MKNDNIKKGDSVFACMSNHSHHNDIGEVIDVYTNEDGNKVAKVKWYYTHSISNKSARMLTII